VRVQDTNFGRGEHCQQSFLQLNVQSHQTTGYLSESLDCRRRIQVSQEGVMLQFEPLKFTQLDAHSLFEDGFKPISLENVHLSFQSQSLAHIPEVSHLLVTLLPRLDVHVEKRNNAALLIGAFNSQTEFGRLVKREVNYALIALRAEKHPLYVLGPDLNGNQSGLLHLFGQDFPHLRVSPQPAVILHLAIAQFEDHAQRKEFFLLSTHQVDLLQVALPVVAVKGREEGHKET
jgi:hypothetical protein